MANSISIDTVLPKRAVIAFAYEHVTPLEAAQCVEPTLPSIDVVFVKGDGNCMSLTQFYERYNVIRDRLAAKKPSLAYGVDFDVRQRFNESESLRIATQVKPVFVTFSFMKDHDNYAPLHESHLSVALDAYRSRDQRALVLGNISLENQLSPSERRAAADFVLSHTDGMIILLNENYLYSGLVDHCSYVAERAPLFLHVVTGLPYELERELLDLSRGVLLGARFRGRDEWVNPYAPENVTFFAEKYKCLG
jgi:hypothetical protein